MYVTTSRTGRKRTVKISVYDSTWYADKNSALYGRRAIVGNAENQRTYSWRTGRRVRESGALSMFAAPPLFAIRKGDSASADAIRHSLEARRMYYEQMQQVTSGDSYTAGGKRVGFNQDHDFYTHRSTFSGEAWTRRGYAWPGYRNTEETLVGLASVGAYPAYNLMGVQASTISGFTIDTTTTQLGSFSAKMFGWARPDASIAGIGETAVELLRGNFPSLVSRTYQSIQKQERLLKAVRRTGKAAGQDYLNSVFGWAPIIRDLQSIIQQGFMLHDQLFGGFTSRRRSMTSINEVIFSNPGNLRNVPCAVRPVTQGFSFGAGGVYTAQPVRWSIHQDHRLSLHVVNARPGVGSMNFIDKAIAMLQHIGAWHPSLAWDLTPYSWLLDWFAHLGQGIDNVSTYARSGSFPAERATITSKTKVRGTLLPGYTPWQKISSTAWAESRWGTLESYDYYLERRKANAFTGSLNLNLNSGQWAILTALGFAKAL